MSLLWLIFPLFFIWLWKRLCIDARIEIRDGILRIISAWPSKVSVTQTAIRFSNYKVPTAEIKSISLERRKISQNGWRLVGKGEPFIFVTNLKGEKIDLSIQVFSFEKVKTFLTNNFPRIFVAEELGALK